MDEIVSEECKKRRLPMWMLGVSAADQVKKSKSAEVNDANKNKKEESDAECIAKKSRGRRKLADCDNEVAALCGDALDDEQSNLVVKRQKVTRTKKSLKNDVVSRSDDADKAVVGKKRKDVVNRRVVQKSGNGRKRTRESVEFESREDTEDASPNEDDEDLTMDDLISIAKEIVKDDKDRRQQKKSDAEQIVHKQCSPTHFSRNDHTDNPIVVSETVKKPPAHEEAASCQYLSSTGDPAQDMLDLLLGPLLKHPVKEIKKADMITDDMITAYQLSKQNQKAETDKKTSFRGSNQSNTDLDRIGILETFKILDVPVLMC